MKTYSDKKQQIDRFFNGAMTPPEIEAFTRALEGDGELRAMFDTASGTEAVLHTALPSHSVKLPFETLMKKALDSTRTASASPAVIIPWLRMYAIAATFIMMVMGGYIVYMSNNNFRNRQAMSDVRAARANHEKQHPFQGKSIMRLSPSTFFLAEEGTKSRIIRDSDSVVNVVISQGNACFDVNKQEKRQIVVATPHIAITLHGSVTRIVVTELETEVAVLEGNAEIVHRYNTAAPSELSAGSAMYADFQTLQTAEALTPDVCKSRKSMFRAYVAWVQQQAHG